jgi:zinc D-Ala-D-Ala carboxypeptidase
MATKMLSANFALEEFTESQTAARKGIDNTPDAATLKNLKALADALEVVREKLGNLPMRISSGYRSPALNKAVGGSKNSSHMSGLAVDFTAPRFGTVLQTAKAVAASGIDFDQIIY